MAFLWPSGQLDRASVCRIFPGSRRSTRQRAKPVTAQYSRLRFSGLCNVVTPAAVIGDGYGRRRLVPEEALGRNPRVSIEPQ